MNIDEMVDNIKKNISLLMFENRVCFPILESIFLSAEHFGVPDKDIEFYVRQTIESRIGLSYIVRNKFRGYNETYLYNEPEIREKLRSGLLKSIASEYVHGSDYEIIKKFNKIDFFKY